MLAWKRTYRWSLQPAGSGFKVEVRSGNWRQNRDQDVCVIRASLREVEHSLIIAIVLVTIVVYVFLRNIQAALIPAIVVPVSLISMIRSCYDRAGKAISCPVRSRRRDRLPRLMISMESLAPTGG
jgi:hypothetical protein